MLRRQSSKGNNALDRMRDFLTGNNTQQQQQQQQQQWQQGDAASDPNNHFEFGSQGGNDNSMNQHGILTRRRFGGGSGGSNNLYDSEDDDWGMSALSATQSSLNAQAYDDQRFEMAREVSGGGVQFWDQNTTGGGGGSSSGDNGGGGVYSHDGVIVDNSTLDSMMPSTAPGVSGSLQEWEREAILRDNLDDAFHVDNDHFYHGGAADQSTHGETTTNAAAATNNNNMTPEELAAIEASNRIRNNDDKAYNDVEEDIRQVDLELSGNNLNFNVADDDDNENDGAPDGNKENVVNAYRDYLKSIRDGGFESYLNNETDDASASAAGAVAGGTTVITFGGYETIQQQPSSSSKDSVEIDEEDEPRGSFYGRLYGVQDVRSSVSPYSAWKASAKSTGKMRLPPKPYEVDSIGIVPPSNAVSIMGSSATNNNNNNNRRRLDSDPSSKLYRYKFAILHNPKVKAYMVGVCVLLALVVGILSHLETVQPPEEIIANPGKDSNQPSPIPPPKTNNNDHDTNGIIPNSTGNPTEIMQNITDNASQTIPNMTANITDNFADNDTNNDTLTEATEPPPQNNEQTPHLPHTAPPPEQQHPHPPPQNISNSPSDAITNALKTFDPVWFDRRSGWEGITFSEAVNFCFDRDQRTPCPYEIYCNRGSEGEPHLGPRPNGEQWAAVSNGPNQWVQVGAMFSCQRYTDLHDKKKPEWGITGVSFDPQHEHGAGGITQNVMCCLDVNHLGPVSDWAKEDAIINAQADGSMETSNSTGINLEDDDEEEMNSPSDGNAAVTSTTIADDIMQDFDEQDIIDFQKREKAVISAFQPIWFSSAHGWKGTTYEEAILFCESYNHMVLCPYAAYCPNGPGMQALPGSMVLDLDGEEWVPANGPMNTWILVGTLNGDEDSRCRLHHEILGERPEWGVDGSRTDVKHHIMCCLM